MVSTRRDSAGDRVVHTDAVDARASSAAAEGAYAWRDKTAARDLDQSSTLGSERRTDAGALARYAHPSRGRRDVYGGRRGPYDADSRRGRRADAALVGTTSADVQGAAGSSVWRGEQVACSDATLAWFDEDVLKHVMTGAWGAAENGAPVLIDANGGGHAWSTMSTRGYAPKPLAGSSFGFVRVQLADGSDCSKTLFPQTWGNATVIHACKETLSMGLCMSARDDMKLFYLKTVGSYVILKAAVLWRNGRWEVRSFFPVVHRFELRRLDPVMQDQLSRWYAGPAPALQCNGDGTVSLVN